MSIYRYHSDYRKGERDFENKGRYGYEENRYNGRSRDDLDYQAGFNDAKRAEESRQKDRAAEEAAKRQAEADAKERRRIALYYEEEDWARRQAEAEQEEES